MRYALLALAMAIPAAAQEPRFIDNDENTGLVAEVATPRWPRDAREGSARVDVTGKLTPAGKLQEPSVTMEPPENAAFAEAVREVLPKWRFRTPQNAECAPSTDPVHVRIHFEDEGGKRRVRVTHSEEAVEPRAPGAMKAVYRKEPLFPRSLLRDMIGARVFSRAEVAPDGSVTGVRVRAFSPDVDPQSKTLAPYEVEVARAVRLWKFSPAPEGADRVRISCLVFEFRTPEPAFR